jgi:hypothetical protein
LNANRADVFVESNSANCPIDSCTVKIGESCDGMFMTNYGTFYSNVVGLDLGTVQAYTLCYICYVGSNPFTQTFSIDIKAELFSPVDSTSDTDWNS